ncbi:aminoglycoside adenylyltransferase domain-containing protein [Aestuariimicrobium ganziense]|uniref:aminoglycoside adenylyltransferase domain-containing protein n=1 Tax=Aestuariimicrobium ganziense TaxID=2773677 RepID=UPI0019431198|nr:aminoglycoside adenylyltransferase domain-containing protein [Aestuariimicrobium ganziense]
MTTPHQQVVDLFASALDEACGAHLLSLGLHGSLVVGDFDSERSDLDLVAVHDRMPDDGLLEAVRGPHELVERTHPDWEGRIEVDHVSPDLVASVIAGTPRGHLVRISPGEPLHLVETSRHYVLNWHSAQQASAVRPDIATILGRPVAEVTEPIREALAQAVVADHLRNWTEWVDEMTTPGGQAYAVLAICRAVARLETGVQLSKLAAGRWALDRFPGRRDLLEWAITTHVFRGPEVGDRAAELADFVQQANDEVSPAGR